MMSLYHSPRPQENICREATRPAIVLEGEKSSSVSYSSCVSFNCLVATAATVGYS